jgi:UDP-N-acetylglucosamine 2-epimerase
MLKVMTIVGTRPELIKLSRVIEALDRYTEQILIHTGQNFDYELNRIFFDQLAIRRPDAFLEAAGGSAMETIGRVLVGADEALVRYQPDAVLILGDTNSCLAVIAAKRRKIPIFHMEAGNRCFDQRVPEEINRRIIDHVSDINLTYSEHARRYLLAEGLPPETVIKTGSPMREVIAHHRAAIDASPVLAELALERDRYLVVSAHREENVDVPERLAALVSSVNALAAQHDMPIIFSVHPRTRQRLDGASELALDSRVRALKPLGFFEYVKLQMHAFCVVSDSGTITEESSLLGFPAVTIRQAHERPEGMDEGVLIMSDIAPAQLLDAVRVTALQRTPAGARQFHAPADYAADNVSEKVVRIILSYVDYVRRTVWFENLR